MNSNLKCFFFHDFHEKNEISRELFAKIRKYYNIHFNNTAKFSETIFIIIF